jgi:L-aminopeptidase/D-esterase-like protein
MTRVCSITDLEGILVGHYTLSERPTGCTVITSPKPFVAGVDVRGGAHAPRDGGTVFAISTGAWEGKADAGVVGALADAMAAAILRGVMSAESWGGFPSARDYNRSASRLSAQSAKSI